MRTPAWVLAFLVTAIATARPSRACSCPAYTLDARTIGEFLDSSKVVFEGTVVHVQLIPSPASVDVHLEPARMASFEVAWWWKNSITDIDLPRVTVFSGDGDSDCGYVFETGKTYIVFATLSGPYVPGALNTNNCSPTRSTSEPTAADLARLLDLAATREVPFSPEPQ